MRHLFKCDLLKIRKKQKSQADYCEMLGLSLDYTIRHSVNNSLNDFPLILMFYFSIAENDDDCIDEGIEEGDKRWDDETEEERNNTKELEHIIEVRKTALDISTYFFFVFYFVCRQRQLINCPNTNAN